MEPSSRSQGPVRVVYVAGNGRSGSTVLGTMLGNHPDAVHVGELEHLPDKGWTNNRYCACGRRALACPLWSAVRQRWVERVPGAGVEGYLALQRRFTRRRSLPRHLGPLRGWSRGFRRWAELTGGLLEAVRDVSGAGILVDSSKNPVRAVALSRIPELDVRVVHLVRDGRGVLWSLKQSYEKDEAAGIERAFQPQPTWRVAALWILSNLLAEHACRHVGEGRSTRLTYERMVDDPEGAMAALGPLMGRDLGSLGAGAAAGDAFATGHVIAGNRLRMQDEVRLRADRTWREKLGASDRRLFRLLAGPMMRRYGYRRDG